MDLRNYGKNYQMYAREREDGKVLLGMSKDPLGEIQKIALGSEGKTEEEILRETPRRKFSKITSTDTSDRTDATVLLDAFTLHFVELFGLERMEGIPKRLRKAAEEVDENSKKRGAFKPNEKQKDEIFKFYYDFLLVRIFGWDVAYRPYKFVMPFKPQLLGLSECLKVPVADLESYMKDALVQKQFMVFVRAEFDIVHQSRFYDMMRYPDQIKWYLESHEAPFKKPESKTCGFSHKVKYHSLIELHVQYELAKMFEIDTYSGAPYSVLNMFPVALDELCDAVGVSRVQWQCMFYSEEAQTHFRRRFEQQLRTLHGKVMAELYLNPIEVLAMYALDF